MPFCARTPDQCPVPDGKHKVVNLDNATWDLLVRINLHMNNSIKAMTDADHYGVPEYWTIATDGYGDCEDVALTKRKALIGMGLPSSALRIAVVITQRDERHAVLTVATDRGDYVLDNLNEEVLPWTKLGYIWLARQDPDRRLGWVTINAMPDMATAATSAER